MKRQNKRNIIIVLTLINVFYSCGIFKGEKTSAVSPNKIIIKTNFSTPIYSVEEINFVNESGFELSGTLFKARKSKVAIIFTHSFMPDADQTELFPLAEELAKLGITSLTFDFPGFGKSEGYIEFDLVDTDVRSAINFLRGLGYSKIASLGVGVGGLGTAKNALDLVGMITISAPTGAMCTLIVTKEDFAIPYPKLFIAAIDTAGYNKSSGKAARRLYDLSVEPKEILIFSSKYQAMGLFRSEHGKELTELIIKFFKTINEKY